MSWLTRYLPRALAAGALAGAWLSFADYGALWLWLPVLRDRAWLLARLLASLMPLGALLAVVGVALTVASRRLVRGVRWAGLCTALSLPASWWLSGKLCAGGMMSRLAARYPLQPTITLALAAGCFVALLAAERASTRLRDRRMRWRVGLAALIGASALAKLNQLVLPNLYDYLHALLALFAFALAAVGVALVLERWPRASTKLARSWPLIAVALLLMAVANALTLDANLNVRVALFDARSPTSRALFSAVDPWLRAIEPRRAAPRYRPRDTPALPASAPGAHILLVTIDALRADHLGLYGHPRPVSPKLDALARDAIVFERAYAQAPHSSYSLSSLHTSAYLHEVVELGRPLPEATLARALAAHGYHTAAFYTSGIFHTEGEKLAALRDSAYGFALFDQTDRESEAQTDRVLKEVDRIKQRGEPPSLLWVHYFDVHEPYQETTFGTSEVDRYDSEILHVDRELDRLLGELSKRLTRPLVVAISADHGEEFRDHGGVYHGSTLYDEQVRVPLILKVPGSPGQRVAAPVEVIDIAPTLLATVGAPVPRSMRGRDLRATAQSGRLDQPVFSAVLTKRMALRWPHKLIADLRFGLYELYDLERDPEERKNLAGAEPALLDDLRGLAYGWLDSIDDAADRDDPLLAYRRALDLGRLGDRRAVQPTAALLLDRAAPTDLRLEAGQNLAKLADPSSVPALLEGLHEQPPEVAAEAAIALGRLYDARARDALRALMHVEDPHLRARAAVSLGRLRDRAAVPALIEALWVAPTQYEREEAVRWLGRLGDPRATEPLLSLLSDFSLRYLLAVALGQVGGMSKDLRAYPDLVGMLEWESRTNIRDEVVRGLGLLGDARAIPVLVRLFEQDPALKNTSESLVRLGALQRGAIGGLDLGPRSKGLSRCVEGPFFHDWDYLQRTHCSAGPRASLALPLPASRRDWTLGAQLVVRGRRADAREPVTCALALAGRPLASWQVEGDFREARFDLPTGELKPTSLALTIDCPEDVALTLDHVLVIPRSQASASL